MDLVSFLLSLVYVALESVGSHDEMGVDSLDLFLKFALEPAGHRKHDDERRHAQHHTYRRDRRENREETKQHKEDRSQQGGEHGHHRNGFDGAVVAARKESDEENDDRDSKGNERTKTHSARRGLAA